MAGASGGTPADEPSRAQMMRVLVPAGAIAVVVVLVAVLTAAFEGDKPGPGKGGKGGPGGTDGPSAVTSGPGQPMSDGSNGGTDDPDLKDLTDGVRYRDLEEGSGEPVKPGASVTIHYTGWNVTGKVFDTSKKTGGPVTFDLGGLIKGWQVGIPGMKPGGIRKLVIPAAAGYGPRGSGEDIPPGATLIFEVQLVK